MNERASLPVGFPVSNPTSSYWLDPPDEIANYQSASSLPEDVETVIIGSGITGATIAYNLLTSDSYNGETIVMLEARQPCSGATGRNGGHTKAASYRSFLANVETHGLATAVKIARFEYNNITSLHAFARDNHIECDLYTGDTVDVFYSEGEWEDAQEAIAAIQDAMPDELETVARYEIWTAEEARETFHVNGEECFGAVNYQAGSLSAYRFVIGILKLCLELDLQLYTNTPATNLERNSSGLWSVTTPKGTLKAKRVILATNGYTAAIWPPFQAAIVPMRGQITAQIPPSTLPRLPTTYSFIYKTGYEYMIPKPLFCRFPPCPGDIVIGGGLTTLPDNGAEEFGITDDGALNPALSTYLTQCTQRYFGPTNGKDSEVIHEWKVRKEWTGIMGFTGDGMPFIGEVPGEEGLWVAAAFQGHGMVLCWGCAKALVRMIEAGDSGDGGEEFPRPFKLERERIAVKFRGRHS